MIVIGRALLSGYDELWTLVAASERLLRGSGGAGDSPLMLLAENATASVLTPWQGPPTEEWTQGRVFGPGGQIQWRAYGPLLRAALLVEPGGEAAGETERAAAAIGWEAVETLPLQPEEEPLFLWRAEPYERAHVRRYRDADGTALFVRYVRVEEGDGGKNDPDDRGSLAAAT